jgi:hypothetical protein
MLTSVYLEIVLILMQVRCTVCAKRNLGLEILLDATNVHLGDEAPVHAHFGLYWR